MPLRQRGHTLKQIYPHLSPFLPFRWKQDSFIGTLSRKKTQPNKTQRKETNNLLLKNPHKNKPKLKYLTEKHILSSHSQSVIVPASLFIKKEKYLFFLLYCKVVRCPTSFPYEKEAFELDIKLLVLYLLHFKITLNIFNGFIWLQESLSSEMNEA